MSESIIIWVDCHSRISQDRFWSRCGNRDGFIRVLYCVVEVVERTFLFNILNFLSLQKIFKNRPPDLSKEGFYFERIEGDAVINKGILRTENFVMKSPVFNAVGSGKVDMVQRTTDFNLGTQPLGVIDTLFLAKSTSPVPTAFKTGLLSVKFSVFKTPESMTAWAPMLSK